MGGWLTVLVGALASVTPYVLHLPPPFNLVATGLIAGITGAYHLYADPPK